MANAFSIGHNFDQPVYRLNTGLVAQTMASKQQRLDTNRALLKQSLAEYSKIFDVIKDVDQEYVNNRVTQVNEIISNHTGASLESTPVLDSLVGNIDEVIDSNVQNAIASSQRYRADQVEWEEAKKDPKRNYSDINRAYAQQFAEPWLNNQEVGAVYNGGAGYIDYVDVNKVVQENIVEATKQIEEEYIQIRNTQGINAAEKYKAVNRDRLEASIEGMLDEKSRNQMRINAWAQYSQAPETQVRAEYNNYFNQKVAGMQADIDKTKKAMENENVPAQRELFSTVIASKQANLNKFKKLSSYDEVAQTSGRTGIENLLYETRFKDNYLNAYAKEPILVERGVDKWDEANKNYALQLERLAISKINSMAKTAKTNSAANGTLAGPVIGATATLEIGEEGEKSRIEIANQYKNKAANELASIAGVENPSMAFIADMSKAVNTNLQGKSEIKFMSGGNEYIIPVAEARVKIDNFNAHMTGNDPLTKQADEIIRGKIHTLSDNFTALMVAGGGEIDENLENIRHFGYKLVEGGASGKYLVQDFKTEQEAKTYWKNLWTKTGNLTPEEQKTKELYMYNYAMTDSGTSTSGTGNQDALVSAYQREVIRSLESGETSKLLFSDTDVDNIQSGNITSSQFLTKTKEYERLTPSMQQKYSQEIQKFKGQRFNTATQPLVEKYRDELIKKYKAQQEGNSDTAARSQKEASRLLSKINKYKRLAPSSDYWVEKRLSDIDKGDSEAYVRGDDLEYQTLSGDTRKIGLEQGAEFGLEEGFNTLMDFTNTYNQINEVYKNAYELGQSYSQAFSQKLHGTQFEILKTALEVPDNIKSISLKREISPEGEETGNYTYTYKVREEGYWTETPGTLTPDVVENLRKQGVNIQTGSVGRTRYNAKLGSKAATIDLGNSYITPKEQQLNSTGVYQQEVQQNISTLSKLYKGTPKGDFLNQAVQKYNNGDYSFQMVPNGSVYEQQLIDSQTGEVLFSNNTTWEALEDQDVENLYKTSVDIKQGMFNNYLNYQIQTQFSTATPQVGFEVE